MKKTVIFAAKTIAAASLATFVATTAIAVPASCGSALKADQTTLAPDLIRSNVPTCEGDFVSGFQVIGNGGIAWYADAMHADRCFNVDVTFLPADISAYDMDAIQEYLGIEVDVFTTQEISDCYYGEPD